MNDDFDMERLLYEVASEIGFAVAASAAMWVVLFLIPSAVVVWLGVPAESQADAACVVLIAEMVFIPLIAAICCTAWRKMRGGS